MIVVRCVTCGAILKKIKRHWDLRPESIHEGARECPETRGWVDGTFQEEGHRETTCHNYGCTHDCRWKHGFSCDCQCHPSNCDRGKSCDYSGRLHQHGCGNAYFLMPPLPPYVKGLMSETEEWKRASERCHYVYGTGDWTQECGEDRAHLTHSPKYAGTHKFVPLTPPRPGVGEP